MTTSPFHSAPRRAARARGFTLIELMIAVAIVGILGAIALPSYLAQAARGKRGDAQSVLLEDAQYMARYYAANNTYLAANGVTPTLTYQTSPRYSSGGAVNYNVSIDASYTTATQFRLLATPTGPMASDACGTFTYTDQNLKGVNNSTGQTVANCWR